MRGVLLVSHANAHGLPRRREQNLAASNARGETVPAPPTPIMRGAASLVVPLVPLSLGDSFRDDSGAPNAHDDPRLLPAVSVAHDAPPFHKRLALDSTSHPRNGHSFPVSKVTTQARNEATAQTRGKEPTRRAPVQTARAAEASGQQARITLARNACAPSTRRGTSFASNLTPKDLTRPRAPFAFRALPDAPAGAHPCLSRRGQVMDGVFKAHPVWSGDKRAKEHAPARKQEGLIMRRASLFSHANADVVPLPRASTSATPVTPAGGFDLQAIWPGGGRGAAKFLPLDAAPLPGAARRLDIARPRRREV